MNAEYKKGREVVGKYHMLIYTLLNGDIQIFEKKKREQKLLKQQILFLAVNIKHLFTEHISDIISEEW